MSEKEFLVVANVIIGSRPEPFFSACLASIGEAVDFLVLNDNSGDPENPNLKALRSSKMFMEGRTALLLSDLRKLSGFDEARNLCLQETGRRFPERNIWILYLDSDEVHTSRLTELTRGLLGRLPPSVAAVDGYYYQFIQSFDYYYAVERRHNLFFRYHPGLRWEKPIHSELAGVSGRRMATGYVYFHYGYVYSPESILRRWKLYKAYDSVPFDPDAMSPRNLFEGWETLLVPFKGSHPEALKTHVLHENGEPEHVVSFTRAARSFFQKHPWRLLWCKIKEMNWRLRLAYRDFQVSLA